jgi:amino acid permease
MRGSIFAMLSSTLGAGMLSFPKAFSDNGLILGLLLIALAAVNAFFSMKFLVYASFKTGIINYSLLVEDRLGKVVSKIYYTYAL